MEIMKLKSFCTTKEMVSKFKRLPREWEKIYSSYTSDKGLITRINRKLKKLNSPKIYDPMKKWGNELNRALSKEEVQMAKKHMKNCSPSLAIKEMQIKTMLRFHLDRSKMAVKVGNQKSVTSETTLRYWSYTWVILITSTQNNNPPNTLDTHKNQGLTLKTAFNCN
jgi:hypothetical protein